MIDRDFELQVNTNGRREPGQFESIGSPGLESYGGWITKAYNTELFWPGVAPLYERIWRSDPETTITRNLFSAWAGHLTAEWTVPEMKGPDGDPLPPSDDDKRAAYFANTAMDDIEGGIDAWLASAITRVPFFGWGYWETVAGLRKQGWSPPGDDDWESRYDDGLVGVRRLAFRDYSSFMGWDMDDATGRVRGMKQLDPPNQQVTIPVDRALHIRYGDLDNPEGLATLEAIWRLERIKYGLEVVQGIGFEHAAGHAKLRIQGPLDGEAKVMLRKAARALMTAQEGNYITELLDDEGNPKFIADIIDVNFQAAAPLLEAIRYYGILKLALLGMQFVAFSSLSGSGSFAAINDASEMALLMFNNIAGGIVKQGGAQLSKHLFGPRNRGAFPGMTRRPELSVNELEKPIPLAELGAFLTAVDAILPLGDDDVISIRSKSSGVLSETPPEEDRGPERQGDDMEPQEQPETGPGRNRDVPENVAGAGLNGAQIRAVLDVLGGMQRGEMTSVVAVELLIAVGIERTRAQRIVDSMEGVAVVPEPNDEEQDGELSDLAKRNVLLPEGEEPDVLSLEPLDPAAEAERVVRRFRRWAAKEEPTLARLLDAEIVEDDDA